MQILNNCEDLVLALLEQYSMENGEDRMLQSNELKTAALWEGNQSKSEW